jgi:hypothetical protein
MSDDIPHGGTTAHMVTTPAQKPTRYALREMPPEPSSHPGCHDCLSRCVRRENARSVGDYSTVSDMNVELRQHQREAHR